MDEDFAENGVHYNAADDSGVETLTRNGSSRASGVLHSRVSDYAQQLGDQLNPSEMGDENPQEDFDESSSRLWPSKRSIRVFTT
jgi:hypothetical protein